jgi:mono/diheme cytochrome c family protein
MHGFLMIATIVGALAQQPTPDGKALYLKNCQGCHGARAIPSAAMVKMMKVPKLDASYFGKRNADTVAVVLKKGRGNMKAFTGKLNDDEMLAIGKYLKALTEEK